MLDTISEDAGMAFRKDPIVHQTLEFQRPLRVQVDFEATRRNRNTNGARSANEIRTRRYGSVINMDDISLYEMSHSSNV